MEKGGDFGGTWYWNRYPGAACDIESFQYSFSMDPGVEQGWTWSRRCGEKHGRWSLVELWCSGMHYGHQSL